MLYFGIVEDIQDPLNSGRVKVRVLPFYREFSVEDLPWAYVTRSTDFGNTFGRGINQHNLIEGSQVIVEFLDQELQQPIVLGIVPRTSDFVEMQSYLTHTMKFLNGSEITVDETPGAECIKVVDTNQNFILMNGEGITIHSGKEGNKIVIESEGNVDITSTAATTVTAQQDVNLTTEANTTITTKGNTTITSDGNTSITTKGDTSIKSDGNINIDAASANIKASGNATIEASKLSLKNVLGTSQLCKLPACLFTGAPHQSPDSEA